MVAGEELELQSRMEVLPVLRMAVLFLMSVLIVVEEG